MCFGDRQRNNVRFRKLRALSRDLPIHREMALRAVLVASYESVYPLISHISQYVDYMESFQVLRLSASCDLAMSREMCRFVVLYMCSICFNCAFLIYYIIMVLFLQWKYKKLLWSLSCNSKSTWRLARLCVIYIYVSGKSCCWRFGAVVFTGTLSWLAWLYTSWTFAEPVRILFRTLTGFQRASLVCLVQWHICIVVRTCARGYFIREVRKWCIYIIYCTVPGEIYAGTRPNTSTCKVKQAGNDGPIIRALLRYVPKRKGTIETDSSSCACL